MTRIIVIGPIKSEFILLGINQYLKWIRKYEKIRLIQIPLSGDLNKLSPYEYKEKDFTRISDYFSGSYNVVMDENGEALTSIEFSKFYEKAKSTSGKKFINFLIGGPLGHSKKIFNYCDKIISLSKFTFTHELSVLLILEQLFRANKILKNEKYHY